MERMLQLMMEHMLRLMMEQMQQQTGGQCRRR